MTPRILVVASLAGACALVLAGGCGRAPVSRPNVVLLVLDTVRRDRMSCYGYARDTTPALARFAEESVVFEQAVSAAPWTLPSHASMFTGLRPSEHQAHHEHLGLDASRTTLAERLVELGYETFAVSNNPWVSERTGLTQGFEALVEPWRSAVAKDTFALNVFPDEEKHGLPDAGAEASLEAVDSWFGGRDARRPFFLFVNLIEAHAYYAPPGAWRHRFTPRELDLDEVRDVNFGFLRQAHRDRLSERTLALVGDLYDGELAYLDAWFARFVELLAARTALADTLVVVTSDHGEAFGAHRRCDVQLVDHQLSLFDELLAVPLIVRFPASHGAAANHGRRVKAPVSSLDLLPTILDVVGVPVERGIGEGMSLAVADPPSDRVIVSEYYRPLAHLDSLHALIGDPERVACLADRRAASVRRAGWKLTLDTRGEAGLFDLADDPDETRPLPLDAAPEELADEARRLLEHMERGFDVPPPPGLGAAQREALRALGYVGGAEDAAAAEKDRGGG